MPLALFGAKGFGAVLGLIATPILVVNAFSPAVFALLVDRFGWQTSLYALFGLLDSHVARDGADVPLVRRGAVASAQSFGSRSMTAQNRLAVVLLLGTAQTLAWASTFYLPAILADRIAADLGMSSTWFFAAFSAALIVSAMVGPRAGRTVDAIGAREVLAVSNVMFAVGLVVLGFAYTQTTLWVAWLILGLGMGIGLYDTAFAALGRIYGLEARSSITGITLLAGFASTVGWPLTAWGATELGWRETCLAWAAAHIVLGLPLNLLLPKSSRTRASEATPRSLTFRSTGR